MSYSNSWDAAMSHRCLLATCVSLHQVWIQQHPNRWACSCSLLFDHGPTWFLLWDHEDRKDGSFELGLRYCNPTNIKIFCHQPEAEWKEFMFYLTHEIVHLFSLKQPTNWTVIWERLRPGSTNARYISRLLKNDVIFWTWHMSFAPIAWPDSWTT